MSIDYDKICQDNLRWHGEGYRVTSKALSESLYTDDVHFIYELLQNAEDALERRNQENSERKLSSCVTFILYKDRLEVRHFGKEFDIDDVKSITSFLQSTKSENSTQIGSKGIGFKSVYVFTSTPEIHSGDKHFIIKERIFPQRVSPILSTSGETVFILPFDNNNYSREEIFQIIEKKLKELGSRVLLFLKNITKIEWEIEGQGKGYYFKKQKQLAHFVQNVTMTGEYELNRVEEEWLVFKKQLEVADSLIEIAFRVVEDEEKKQRSIRAIESSPLIVYFPTAQETDFGFLIQGPYETTASRSEIKGTDADIELIKETGDLLTETIFPWVKENKFLDINFLTVLPLDPNRTPQGSLFRPIYEKVRVALKNQEFLPTADGKYVAGKNAILARGEDLVNLISSNQLSFLLDKSQKLEWLTPSITQNTEATLYRYMIGEKQQGYYGTGEDIEPLIVAEVRPANLIERLTSTFLEKQSTSWLLKFYSFFSKRSALLDALSSKPIIRLENGSHVTPFKQDGEPNAYLQPENNRDTGFPIIAAEIGVDEETVNFLKKLGLTQPNIIDEVIKYTLPRYRQNDLSISDAVHLQDIENILSAYNTDSRNGRRNLIEKLKDTAFILTDISSEYEASFKKPASLYIFTDELEEYFSGNTSVSFVRPNFYSPRAIDFFKELGVADEIRIKCKSKNDSTHVDLSPPRGNYKRGLCGFDPDIDIEGIRHAISNPSFEKSKIIWNKIAIEYSHCIKGTILESSRQDFSPDASHYQSKEWLSDFGKLLINNSWLPNKKDELHTPTSLKLDDLPKEFTSNKRLADQLSMQKDGLATLAQEAGVSPWALNAARELEKNPELYKEFEELKRNKSRTVNEKKLKVESNTSEISSKDNLHQSFNRPEEIEIHDQVIETGAVKDPKYRREKSREDHKERLENEPNPTDRYKETRRKILEGPDRGTREYLFQFYGGKCQICNSTFLERNRTLFFMANYIVPRHKARFMDTPANAFSLCADHFARWQHGVVESDNIIEQIQNFKTEKEGGESKPILTFSLCGEECRIEFVEKHLLDLQELLNADQDIS